MVPSRSPVGSSSTQRPKLFLPIQVGDIALAHRVVCAPLTRCRANNQGVHGDLAVEHYTQRASVPGTLLIAEATYISRFAEGWSPHVPGIYTEEQIAAWRRVVEAVHANGSFVFLQLWALGRASELEYLREQDPDFAYVSSSDIPLTGRKDVPRPLTKAEIKEYAEAFAHASRNAVHKAGFDGVELHGAYGYLIDQFTQDTANRRTDEYGGSIENRCRFALEMVDAVCKAIGETKTAIRISPWSIDLDMRMADPIPTFSYLVSRLAKDHPHLAFLHVVEPVAPEESNDFVRMIWFPRPLITCGRYTRETALKVAEETGQIIGFGKWFISNPDLPLRLLKNIALTRWDRDSFSTPEDPRGYNDYPFAEDTVTRL